MKMNLYTQRDIINNQSLYIQNQLGTQLQAQPVLRLGYRYLFREIKIVNHAVESNYKK